MKKKKYKPYRQLYIIDQRGLKYPCAGMRPTKNCAGMEYTSARSGHKTTDEVRKLLIYGTLDPLARTNKMKTHVNRIKYKEFLEKQKRKQRFKNQHDYGF